MKYLNYFTSLSKEDQDSYAVRAGTTGAYLRTHVFAPKERRKIPRPDLIKKLADATKKKVSFDDVLSFLYKNA